MYKSSMNTRGLAILAIDIVVFFLLLNYLPFSPQENKGLALLVFVGILWLTEAFHITVTSLMVPLFAVGLGVLPTKAALAPFSEPIIFMFFGGFVIAAVLSLQKLDLWLASHLIRFAKGNLKLTIFYIFIATSLLSVFINNTAVTAMMLPLTLGILNKLDVNKNRNLYSFVLLGIAFSSSIGGIATLVGSAPNALLASLTNISFAEWLPYGVPVTLLLLPSMVFALWVILRPDFNQPFDVQTENIPLNSTRIITLVIFVGAALLLIFSKLVNPIISSALSLSEPIKNFDSVVALATVILLCVANTASWSQIQKKTEWGVLMLFGGGLVLSTMLKTTGASKILADTLVHFISDKHLLVTTLLLTSFIVLLTEFTSNTASAALLMPIFISVADSLNLPILSLAAIIACGASCAFMLPIATPPNAIVFATGHIKLKEMVKVGLILNIACILIIGVLSYAYWTNWQ